MHDSFSRRRFIGTGLAAASAVTLPAAAGAQPRQQRRRARAGAAGEPPVVVSSSNGLETVARARELLIEGADPAHAVVRGVKIVEDDPDDITVGYGGLPNEDGVVQLDACVMHGPMHRAGAVAAIENIRNPASVALEVARRTDHVMLVGEGAKRFALRLGFEEENLLTDRARELWLRWKSTLNDQDDWLDPDQFDIPTSDDGRRSDARFRRTPVLLEDTTARGVPYSYGTIHCSAVDARGDIAGCTTTSGLSWKLPGRVGDSPLIGAGCYTDNAVGSAGATGRGEAVIQTCGARLVVMRMEQGDHPTDACLHALRHIAERTRSPRLLDEDGRPNFNVIFYAVRKDGAYGSACMRPGRRFAVADEKGARREDCAAAFE